MLRNSVKTGHTFVEKEAKVQALFDDVAGFSPTSKDFLEQNGHEHHPVEQAGPGPAAAVREVRPGVPLPARGPGQPDPATGADLPELHAAHQPRGAPEQPDRLHARRQPRGTARTTARTASGCPNPPYSQANRTPQPPISRRRRRGHAAATASSARAARPASTSPPATPAPPPSARSSTPSPPPRWESRTMTCPTWPPCCSGRSPAGRR